MTSQSHYGRVYHTLKNLHLVPVLSLVSVSEWLHFFLSAAAALYTLRFPLHGTENSSTMNMAHANRIMILQNGLKHKIVLFFTLIIHKFIKPKNKVPNI